MRRQGCRRSRRGHLLHGGLPDVRGVFSAQVAAVSQATLPAREAQAVLAAGLPVGGNGWRGIRSCWV